MMPGRDTLKPVPNVRGEDENELQYLINIIETLAWQLSPTPTKHPTVLLGRHPKVPSPSTAYIAAVYSMSKGGSKALEMGPETGCNRKEALRRLLEVVEGEVGRGIMRDGRKKGESAAAAAGGATDGSRIAGARGEGVGEGRGRGESFSAGGARMRLREEIEQRDVRDSGMRWEGPG